MIKILKNINIQSIFCRKKKILKLLSINFLFSHVIINLIYNNLKTKKKSILIPILTIHGLPLIFSDSNFFTT